jgi:hypothetical protein
LAARAAVYLLAALLGLIAFVVGAAIYTALSPSHGGEIPIAPPMSAPATTTAPVPSQPSPTPIEQPLNPPEQLIATVPPETAIIHAKIYEDKNTPSYEVIAIGFDPSDKTLVLLLNDLITQQKIVAPVQSFTWQWNQKKPDVAAVHVRDKVRWMRVQGSEFPYPKQ